MKAIIIVIYLLFVEFAYSEAQHIKFEAKYGSETLQLTGKKYVDKNGEFIEFSVLKFYLSNLEFRNKGATVFAPVNQHFLIDFEAAQSTVLYFPESVAFTYDEIIFNLGIDSATNYAGALGGSLDPTLGMYWTWQNGYINFKLEGKSSICKTRNNQFEFHIGGYSTPFKTLQVIRIPIQKREEIIIEMDLRNLLEAIDLNSIYHIMSPCKEAVKFSQQFPFIFSIER